MPRPTLGQSGGLKLNPFGCCRTYSANVKVRIQDYRLGFLDFAISFVAVFYLAFYEMYLHQTPFLRDRPTLFARAFPRVDRLVELENQVNPLANCSEDSTAATYTVSGASTEALQFPEIFAKIGSSAPSVTMAGLTCDASLSLSEIVEQGPNSVFITTMLYDRVTDAGCAGSTEGGCVGSLQNFRFVAVPPDLTLFVQHSWTTYWGHQGETPLVCLQSPQAGVEAVTVIEGASCDHPLSTPGEPATKLSIGDVLLDAGISSIDDRNMGWMAADPVALSGDEAFPTFRMSGVEMLAVFHYQTAGQSDVSKWGWFESSMDGNVRIMMQSGATVTETMRTGIRISFVSEGTVSVFSGRALLNALLRTMMVWIVLKYCANLVAFRAVPEGDVYRAWQKRKIDRNGASTGRIPTEGTSGQAVELARTRSRSRSMSARGRAGSEAGAGKRKSSAADTAPPKSAGGDRSSAQTRHHRVDSSDLAFAERIESEKKARKRNAAGKINRTAASMPREISLDSKSGSGPPSARSTSSGSRGGTGFGFVDPGQVELLGKKVETLHRKLADVETALETFMEKTNQSLRELSADVNNHERVLHEQGGRKRSRGALAGVARASVTADAIDVDAASHGSSDGYSGDGTSSEGSVRRLDDEDVSALEEVLATTPRGTRTLVPAGSLHGRRQDS